MTAATDRKLRRAADRAARARSELESAITEARRDGVPLRTIADAAGISHEQVRRVVARNETPRTGHTTRR